MILSEQERRKFAEWLRQDAESNRLIVGQLEKLPHLRLLADAKRREAEAMEIVARLLSETIGANE